MISAFNIKMLKIVNKFFGTSSERYLKSFTKTLEKINKFEEILTKLSDQELKSKTDYFKSKDCRPPLSRN